jgi:rhodanese-related sulfurtransferase
MLEITVEEVERRLDAGEAIHLLDVREPEEIAICALPDAEHIPMLQLFLGVQRTTAAQDDEVVIVCHHGIRSLEAARFLRRQGFEKAVSMAGGVAAWAQRIDPSFPTY